MPGLKRVAFQSGLKRILAVGMGEAVQEMRVLEILLHVDPVVLFECVEVRPVRIDERPVDELARRHGEAADARRRRGDARSQITSWLLRHSPGGSTSLRPSMMC